jgi:Putative peptidoglycan binding domain
MKRTTSKKLLLGTVALMAGVGLASAQGIREGGSAAGGAEQHSMPSGSPAAKSQGGAEIQSKGEAETRGQAPGKGAIEQKAQAPQRDKSRMSDQAKPERSTTGQGSSEKDEPKAKSSSKEDLKSKSSGADELKSKSKSSAKEDLKAKGQDSAKDSAKGSAKTNERSTTGQATSDKTDMKGAADSRAQTPNATGQNQTGANIQSQAGAKLTSQQQTTIQQSVLSARNVPRVDHVNFAVHTGAIIPRSVNIVAISTFPVLIETFPQYRDYSFFVVEDEIVFVDRGHKVVDVVPVGPRTRFSRASSSTAVAVNLSEPEIREVQLVLVQRGFLHGRVTGVWGPETREALVAFQRKEGFSATGSIDTRTVGALGLSGKVKVQESSSTQGSNSTTTTGQAPSPSTTGQNPPAQNQSTTGQNEGSGQKPSDKQSSGPIQSTTGQGSGSSKPESSGSSMNGGSSSMPSQSGSSSSTPSSSGQSTMPEKNKQN